jgi:hypothetical protein
MELTNSKRLLYKVSYVTTQFTPDEQRRIESKPSGAYNKAFILRSLALKPHDLDRIGTILATQPSPHLDEQRKLLSIAQRISSGASRSSTMALAAEIATIPYAALTNFVKMTAMVKEPSTALSFLITWSEQRAKISPIGRLHLERIEMYPAGVQKGELVFSVPMAPGETITISHKEWSTSSREFDEIVQDYFESYSERGVAEKSDASMSSENESKHANALNFGASLSGSYMGVTLTTTLGLSKTNEERDSVKQSMQKSREVTEKASSRSRQEHKVSMKIETKSGTEDRSAKTITNDSSDAIRIDYSRMMRKWRTDLFRYGLRLTYDIAIPMPGVRLWALHQRVAELDRQLRAPLSFTLKPGDIASWNYRQEALTWGTTIQDPPPENIDVVLYGATDFQDSEPSKITRFGQVDIDVPAGYCISTNAKMQVNLAIWPDEWDGNGFKIISGIQQPLVGNTLINADLPILYGKSGHRAVIYKYYAVSMASIAVNLTYTLLKEAREAWQFAAWNQLRAAALARHQEDMVRIQEERDRLWRLLNGKDTLTLRRLEREELVRLVMQWLLGPDQAVVGSPGDPINLIPPGQNTLAQLLANESSFQTVGTAPAGPTYSPTMQGVSEEAWYGSVLFGEFVKFVHEAIEWENILYFLYPYFWGSETIGRDKMLFDHSDPEHERFLRAGYARIVLTVRPGFEEDFTKLMESGSLGKDSTHPYMTVAEDIANFSRTNYSGIPPANPELKARPLLFPEQRATWDTMQRVMHQLDAFKADNGTYPKSIDDLTGLAPADQVDFWGNPFVYRVPGLGADYDLESLGADSVLGGEGLDADISSAAGASLVATWFEYTPTSALDIELNTKAADIA